MMTPRGFRVWTISIVAGQDFLLPDTVARGASIAVTWLSSVLLKETGRGTIAHARR
jgi:hypothetical protein